MLYDPNKLNPTELKSLAEMDEKLFAATKRPSPVTTNLKRDNKEKPATSPAVVSNTVNSNAAVTPTKYPEATVTPITAVATKPATISPEDLDTASGIADFLHETITGTVGKIYSV